MRDAQIGLVIPSAGKGTRLKSRRPKPYILLRGVPLIVQTLRALKRCVRFGQKVVAADPERVKSMRELLARHGLGEVLVVPGGAERADSVRAAVEALEKDMKWVVIHDAARPFVSSVDVRAALAAAVSTGAAILAEKSRATVKWASVSGRFADRTLNRNRIFLAQTPQVFRAALLRKAYGRFGERLARFTDEAALVEAMGIKVALAPGSSLNFKITTPADLALAQACVNARKKGAA